MVAFFYANMTTTQRNVAVLLLATVVMPVIMVKPAHTQSVTVTFESAEGTASVLPVTIPNPDTGLDITITPSAVIESGSFTTEFASDGTGQVINGLATFSNLSFSGTVDIAIESSIEVFGFPVSVTGNLSGPITVTQVTPSTGQLDDDAYMELSPGLFNVTFGPLACEDSAFGVLCGAIQATLGAEFPTESISVDDAPLPFAVGTFSDLNTPEGSSVSSQISLSIPLGENSLGVDVNFTWSEVGREFVVPEPGMANWIWCFSMSLAYSRRKLRRRKVGALDV